MDATLEGLLKAIDMGDADAIGMLADWLEERGDARSIPVRQATVLDPVAFAEALMEKRQEDEANRGSWNLQMLPEGEEGLVFRTRHLWELCCTDVERALATRKLTLELSKVIGVVRRKKIDELLQLFKEAPSAS